MSVKDITIPTFADKYSKDIQLQFSDDVKFATFMKDIADYSISYQQTLKDFGNSFNLGSNSVKNTYVLNCIGAMLNLPPMAYFKDYGGITGDISYDNYILLIKGQQAKNQWDGTNLGLLTLLNNIFTDTFHFVLEDTGIMEISLWLINLSDTTIDPMIEQLFKDGWLTPKPAGVSMDLYVTSADLIFGWANNDGTFPDGIGGWYAGLWDTTI